MSEFQDSGFNDIEVGTEMFRVLGINHKTFGDPVEVEKIRTIADFTNQFSDGSNIIKSIISKKRIPDRSNIDHAFEYIQLRKKIIETGAELRALEAEATLYE